MILQSMSGCGWVKTIDMWTGFGWVKIIDIGYVFDVGHYLHFLIICQ
jgi:hypothetical protein